MTTTVPHLSDCLMTIDLSDASDMRVSLCLEVRLLFKPLLLILSNSVMKDCRLSDLFALTDSGYQVELLSDHFVGARSECSCVVEIFSLSPSSLLKYSLSESWRINL